MAIVNADLELAITPGGRVGDASPLGHKGGKRRLDDYVRMVAHALMRKRGFTESHAIATAKNALKRWSRGGGHVRPQVRAGAAAHLGTQHAIDKGLSQDDLDEIIDLALVIEAERIIDLAVTTTHKYRHGWIRVDGQSGPVRSKTRVPTGRAKKASQRAHYRRQREQANRIIARVGGKPTGMPRGGKLGKPWESDGPSRIQPSALFGGAGHSQFSQRQLAERIIDLSWREGLHPRDFRGRFAKKGGGKSIVEDANLEAKYRKHVQRVDEYLSSNQHPGGVNPEHGTLREDGTIDWTPERTALHRRLVDQEFRKQVRQGAERNRESIFLGGLPGAGKSSGLKKTLGDVESKYITVNPDIFKERMAHQGLVDKHEGLSPLEASAFHHEESARMALMLADRAQKRGYNIIHDITMNSVGSVSKRLEPLRESGYSAHAMFFDIPYEFSVESVRNRHRRGWLETQKDPNHVGQRLVPSSHVASGKSKTGSSSANRDAFDQAKHMFDSFDLYDQGTTYAMLLKEQKRRRK